MMTGFEFWSSVEYGTFLKGLVRELCAQSAKEECGVQSAEVGLQSTKVSRGAKLATTFSANIATSAKSASELLTTRYPLLATAAQRFSVTEADYRQARGMLARLRMRWRCYVGYPLRLRRRIRRDAPAQALVVCTNTFFAPWVAMRAARKRGVPVVHWMFDLFPDVLVLAGKLKHGSLGERLLRRWVRAMFDGAAANVFLGERLLRYAEAKFGPIPHSVVIPVGCDAQPFANREPRVRDHGGHKARPTMSGDGGEITGLETRATEEVRVLYCGNFGRMHDVGTLVDFLRGGVPAGVQLDFRGNGAGFQELAAAVRDLGLGDRVRLAGSLPEAEWLDVMASADVALVTMKPGAEGIVMPSKTYSAMAAGQAVLAVCPRESDLADLITAHDCGWVIEPGDVAGLRALLESLPDRPEVVLQKRRNAWRAGQEVYDQRVLAKQWRELLGGLRPPSGK